MSALSERGELVFELSTNKRDDNMVDVFNPKGEYLAAVIHEDMFLGNHVIYRKLCEDIPVRVKLVVIDDEVE